MTTTRLLMLTLALSPWGLAVAEEAPTGAQPEAIPALDAPQNAAPADAPPPVAPAPKGPPPAVKLECAPKPVRIGDQLLCSLSIVHRRDVSVTVTAPDDVIPLPSAPAEIHLTDMLKTVRTFRIQPRSMKKVKVEGMKVVWTETSGGQGELDIPGQKIPVKSVMTAIKDPKLRTFEEPGGDAEAFWALHGPIPYRVTNWPLIIVLLVILGAAIGIGIGVWIKRLLDGRQVEVDLGILPEEAHLEAAKELAQLESENLPAQERFEEYFVRLSEILRRYLKNRFRIQGLEWTSEELRDWFRSTSQSEEAQRALADFLLETDLVKFANVQATATAIGVMTTLAREVIDLTKLLAENADGTGSQEADV